MNSLVYLAKQLSDLIFWGGIFIIVGFVLVFVVDRITIRVKEVMSWLLEDVKDGEEEE